MAPFKEIPEEDWKSLIHGMVRRQYHLLVGAGINSECIGGDGQSIPDAKVLAEQLIADFGLKTDGEVVDLRRAYESVENLRDTQGRSRTQYFKSRFSNCTPKWQEIIFRLNWRRVWTLNIDDVLENASGKHKNLAETKRKYFTFSWNDPFIELDREKDNVQIVHLHGYSLDSKNLIFSIIEYLKAFTTRNSWHPVFGDEYHPTGSMLIMSLLTQLFQNLYNEFENRGYFQQAFGYTCVDAGEMLGTIGDINAYLLLKLRKDNLWPIQEKCLDYS